MSVQAVPSTPKISIVTIREATGDVVVMMGPFDVGAFIVPKEDVDV